MKSILNRIGKFRIIYIIFILLMFIVYNFPLHYVNKKCELKFHLINNNSLHLYDYKFDLYVNGFLADSLISNKSFNGSIHIDFLTLLPEYKEVGKFNIRTDNCINIKSIIFQNTYEKDDFFGYRLIEDTLIQKNDFQDIVICQLENNVCLLEEDNYILSTFNTLEETNDFVSNYFNDLRK